ncbi:MAG: amino acid adenylation domain-containing protein [Halanaerobiales bacterium]|nr:amino acid adenylation domain-containing protein [Halanaerobiales bacterium]
MLASLFEEQVKKYPDRKAVKTKERELTYQQLNSAANFVGRYLTDKLKDRMDKKETVILLFEHGIDMLIGILSTIKVGFIYVPCDPEYPLERLNYIVKDSNARMIITNNQNKELAEKLIKMSEDSLSLININRLSPDEISTNNLDIEVSNDQIAYLLYTSGSTGQPKGVIQTHANVAHYALNYAKKFKISYKDRMTLLSSFTHDAAVMDIFSALFLGATLYPLKIKGETDMVQLTNWLINEKITIYHSVPTLYRYFVKTLTGEEQFPDLCLIILGGEKVIEYDLHLFKSKFNQPAQLVNLYGQTESSFNSCSFYSADFPVEKITLGEEIDGVEILHLTEEFEEVETFETGQIFIVSDHLAVGYWNDEESSRSFGYDLDLGRIYRTGDYGRRLLNGEIEFVGRKDNQVKIRGYRVEIEEIENHLLAYKDVKEGAVVVVDNEEELALAAWVVGTDDFSKEGLRQYLSSRLSGYMVPTYINQIESLPKTSSQKLDRKKLKELKLENLGSAKEFIAPTNQLEEKLVAIFSKVLKINKISINDNFIESGLHSLRALTVVSLIHKELNADITINDIFAYPTIAQLAEIIDQRGEVGYQRIPKLSEKEYYQLSYAQKRLWYLYQLEPNSSAYNMPGLLELNEPVDIELIKEVLIKLIQRHESLRTRFKTTDEYPVQVIEKKVDLPFKHIDLTDLNYQQQEEKLREIKDQVFETPFNLEKDLLFRVRLIKMAEQKYQLLYCLHHIISDGWSMGILQNEFETFYKTARDETKSKLKPLNIHYKDFAAWQNDLLANDELMKEVKKFWVDWLTGNIPKLKLPVNYAKNNLESRDSYCYRVVIPEKFYQKLKELAQKNKASLFMVLLAGFNVFLARLTNQNDLLIGIPAAGRTHENLHQIIGFFINTLILRTRIKTDETFTQFLKRVQEETLSVLKNQYFPLELVLEELNQAYPEISVFFNMLNMGENKEKLTDLTAKHTPALHENKFDLMCYLGEFSNGIEIRCHYLKGLFKPETVEDFMKQYIDILEKMASDPEQFVFETRKKHKKVRF